MVEIYHLTRTSYLQTLFPIIICSISFLTCIYQLYSVFSTSSNYSKLGQDDLRNESSPDPDSSTDSIASFKHKHSSHSHVVTTVVPAPLELTITVIEAIMALTAIGIQIAAFVTISRETHPLAMSITGMVIWTYISALVILRLSNYFSRRHSSRQFPVNTWFHTASIYPAIWCCAIFDFRSQILYPESDIALALTSSYFGIVSTLTLVILFSRIGNDSVTLYSEPNRAPNAEPLSSIFSLWTYTWFDPLIAKGYKQTLELEDCPDLLPETKAAAVHADYRGKKRTSALWLHILYYVKKDFFVQCAWSASGGLTFFMPTLLMKIILEFVEDPERRPASIAWGAVILLVANELLGAVGRARSLWRGRYVGIKLQALLNGEVYAKSLLRRAAGTKEKQLLKDEAIPEKNEASEQEWDEPDGIGAMKFCFASLAPAESEDDDKSSADGDDGGPGRISTGAILNLMSSDVFRIAEIMCYLQDLVCKVPISLALCIVILFMLLGRSAWVSLASMLLFGVLQYRCAQEMLRLQKKITSASDSRVHQTSEVTENIRIIKLFAWEHRYLDKIDRKRDLELKYTARRYIIYNLAWTCFTAAPVITSALTFWYYTVIEKNPLPPSVAFPALSIFSVLQEPLDTLADLINYAQAAKVSVARIEEYLSEPDTAKYEQIGRSAHNVLPSLVGFDRATFSWGGAQGEDFQLFDLDIKFPIGLNVVFGPTGSGKSSLLLALLGEMVLKQGSVYLPSKEQHEIAIDSNTELADCVAYCAQQPWLMNATVKDNILFANDFNEERYAQVIAACALTRDIEIWKDGDDTPIGEKGVSISGGQKQRVSLARAMYSNARYLLLDDVLSAVDAHTAKWIFEHAIRGPLMNNRTCILVTHNTALTLPFATFSVCLKNGRVAASGSAKEVVQIAELSAEETDSRPVTQPASKAPSIKAAEVVDGPTAELDEPAADEASKAVVAEDKSRASDAARVDKNKLIDETGQIKENKAEGRVDFAVIMTYLKAMGGWKYWILCALAVPTHYALLTSTNLWIRVWANSYLNRQESSLPRVLEAVASINSTAYDSFTQAIMLPHHASRAMLAISAATSPSQPSYDENINDAFYIGIYAVLGISMALMAAFEVQLLFFGSVAASKKLHRQFIEAFTFATMRFYDITPKGRTDNRVSKDVMELDSNVASVLHGTLLCLVALLTTIGVIAYLIPSFLAAAALLLIVYVLVAGYFIGCARDLKRLNSVALSPIFQLFGETLAGVVTIRAYGHQQRFARKNQTQFDSYTRPFIWNWAANRWLAFRADLLSTFVMLSTAAFAILSVGKIDAGAAGLALTYSLTFEGILTWLMRDFAMAEQNMNAVERIHEYAIIEREAPTVIPDNRSPADWPVEGRVEFVDYSTRYAPEFDLALKNLSFKIPAGAKVGVIGRTGAGKSSLALSVLRALEASSGKIVIDGIDVSKLGLHDLREGVLMVPQDPTLFTGTLRSNLDPFNAYTDEEVLDCLRKVHLIGTDIAHAVANTNEAREENQNVFYNLNHMVAESGQNFSQGQRQLLCLARALLKSPKVLLMDEATASIDYATDAKIQATLRGFKHTFITIAHRLKTIVDYDIILVLDRGSMQEFGSPWELLNNEDSTFRSMCEATGELDALMVEAKKAADAKQLVDVSGA